jgi:hypothetical protein
MSQKELKEHFGRLLQKLRYKRRDVTTAYQAIDKRFMRSLEIDEKDKIQSYARRHFNTKEIQEGARDSVKLGDVIYERFDEFVSESCQLDLEEIYLKFCGLRDCLGVPEMNSFMNKRPPKGEIQKHLVGTLDEKGICSYIRSYVETKGSTQGMAERLLVLFPPPKGKRMSASFGKIQE